MRPHGPHANTWDTFYLVTTSHGTLMRCSLAPKVRHPMGIPVVLAIEKKSLIGTPNFPWDSSSGISWYAPGGCLKGYPRRLPIAYLV